MKKTTQFSQKQFCRSAVGLRHSGNSPGFVRCRYRSKDAASEVQSKLKKSEYKNVQVSVDANGIATLTGTVDLYEYKLNADKAAHKAKGVTAVRNDIQVGGPNIPDEVLQKQISEKLTYDRVGYGNAFVAIGVSVHNGVATLGGHARWDPDKDSALALVSTTPGIKDVVDEIEVDPVSPMDDRIRLQVAQAVYGFPSLNKYAIDPAKPIRISVQNGNVELYGVVDSQADKDNLPTSAQMHCPRRLQREELPAGSQPAGPKSRNNAE